MYKLALAKYPIAIVLYGVLAEAAVLSFHGEHYFFGLNQIVKLSIFLAIIYHLPALLVRRRQRVAGVA